VVQEAYLRAYRSIDRFRGEAKITTWLYRITANCASTQLGSRRRHRHDPLDTTVEPADLTPASDPLDRAVAADLRATVEVAIAELPPRLRAVVVLRDVYDLPHDAIAAELGITETAAKVRLHRARRALKARCFPDRRDAPAKQPQLGSGPCLPTGQCSASRPGGERCLPTPAIRRPLKSDGSSAARFGAVAAHSRSGRAGQAVPMRR